MNAPAGSPENTGDGLQMAMNVGAKLGNMRNAWWVPVVKVPGNAMGMSQSASYYWSELAHIHL